MTTATAVKKINAVMSWLPALASRLLTVLRFACQLAFWRFCRSAPRPALTPCLPAWLILRYLRCSGRGTQYPGMIIGYRKGGRPIRLAAGGAPQQEVFGNQPTGTVTSGGTSTSDTAFTVTATDSWPAASTTPTPNTVFRITDQANTTEIMLVTVAPGGSGAGQSWTVVRGAEGSTAVDHAANWTCVQVITAGTLDAFSQKSNLGSTAVISTTTTAASTLLSWTPASQDQPAAGVVYEFAAFGTLGTSSAAPTLTFLLQWNGVTIATLEPGSTDQEAMVTGLSNASWWLEGYVICLSATSMVAAMNLTTHKTTAAAVTWVSATGDNSAHMAGVAVSGTGPLTLTVAYGTSQTANVLYGAGTAQRVQ